MAFGRSSFSRFQSFTEGTTVRAVRLRKKTWITVYSSVSFWLLGSFLDLHTYVMRGKKNVKSNLSLVYSTKFRRTFFIIYNFDFFFSKTPETIEL